MRPPEHWHLNRRRQPRRWPRIAALGALAIAAVALAAWCWPAGGSGGTAAPQSRAVIAGSGCAGGANCVQSSVADFSSGNVPPPKIRGKAAVVIEASCDARLYSHNGDLRLPPASLTKIATALVAVDHRNLSDMVDVQVNSALMAASTGSTVMGLQPGMRLSMGDLLYGLLLPSGNDAAIAIAQEVGGGVPAFVDLMNEKAAALGLQNTRFTNPHGLDEAGLYTSARDIAELGRALVAQSELAAIVRTKQYQPAWDGPEVWNGNELLDQYPGAIGVKIGYTEKAGQTIVAGAERNGRRIIVSVLSTWDRYADATALLDWAFANTQPACQPA
jgi:D-alanyl-D-alanine carboxypeptidase (penicillin-binding protein 5/6)